MTTPYLDAVELPESTTVWTDEYSGTRIGQSVEVDINGTPVIEYISAPAGYQHMSLALGWVTKATLAALKAKRDAETQVEMTVILPDGRELSVVWDHAGGNPIDAEPVQELTDYEDTDYFDTVLNLILIL